jgi:hypothetical protein
VEHQELVVQVEVIKWGQVVVVAQEHQELMVQWFVRSKWIKRCRNIRKFRKYRS